MITEAVPADVDDLSKLFDAYRQFYHCSADLGSAQSYVKERIAQGPTRFFVSRDRVEINGFVHLLPSFDTMAMKPMWVLEDAYVAPRSRCLGIGAALIRFAENIARATGASRLTLSTAHTNHRAQRVYERQGWVLDTKFRYYHRILD